MMDALKKSASKIASGKVLRRMGISILCLLVFLPLLYAVIGFWALPSYIQSKAQRIASEKLHRQLLVDKLAFNPFTFTLNIEGLKLTEPNSEERFVSLDKLDVTLSGLSVLKMTPVVTEFKLVKPFVRIIRFSETERNFDDILALFKSPEDEEKAGEEKKAEVVKKPQTAAERRAERRKRKFGIYNFQIEDGQIELEDRVKDSKTIISDLNVGLPYLYRGPIRGIKRHVEFDFEAMVNGKKLEITREKPVEGSRDRILKLDMDNIDLKRIFNYVPFQPAYQFKEGWLDVHLSFHIHRPKGGQSSLDVGGNVTVRDIRMTQHEKPLLDLERLNLVLGNNSLSKGEFQIEKLELIQPEIHAISDKDGILNFANLLAHADAIAAPVEGPGVARTRAGEKGAVVPASDQQVAQGAPKDGITLMLKEFIVKNGRFRYSDESDDMPMNASAGSFNLSINGLLLDSEKQEITVERVHSPSSTMDVVFFKQHTLADTPKKDEGKNKGKAPEKEEDDYTIKLAKLDIANWSGKLKNSNTADFASLPISATVNKLALTVTDAEIDLKTQAIKVGQVQSNGGSFDVALHSTQQPTGRKKTEDKDAGASAFSIQVGQFGISNWSGKVKNSSAAHLAALPFSAAISHLGITVDNTAIDLKAETISVGAVRSSAGSFDVTLDDHPAGNKASAASEDGSAFDINIGQLGIANWSGKLKNNNKGELAALPVMASISKFGLNMDKASLDMKKQVFSIGHIRSAGGNFDLLMENAPPKVVAAKAGDKETASVSRIHVGQLDVTNWSGKVKNSNRLDPFEMPFSAVFSKLGVAVDDAEVNLKEQTVTVDSVTTKGGFADVELEPYKKPGDKGKRAVARAALLTSILQAQKAQASDGFAIRIGKLGVIDWSARLKNKNTNDRAGLPISGRADKIDLNLSNARIDTKKRDISIGSIVSRGVNVMAQLEKHEKWVPRNAAESGKVVAMPKENPYTLHIDKLAVSGWSFNGRNSNMKTPLQGSVTEISVTGQDLSSTPGKTSQFSMKATVDKTGHVAADGKLGFAPLNMNLALNVKDISLVPIQPYVEDYVNVTLNRGNLTMNGSLFVRENKDGAYEGGYKGDVTVSRLRTIDQINKDSFVRWNTLALRDVNAALLPLSVNVREAELNNFFARVILNADGRLNLHNILRSKAGGKKSLTETDSELDALADGGVSQAKSKGNVTMVPVKVDAVDGKSDLPLVVVEKLLLKKGRVRFTDNFIKPNYTANISEMDGSITRLSSDPNVPARLDLHGEVNNAPLTVAGTISPLKENLSLDIKAHVRGMELAQFSSYTAKYIGYGIEKGKLSFDVEYKVEDGVLIGQNRLILDQLTFGKKTPGEPVTSLPVELAVSLLKDSKGVIDINLPIGGSLEDPEFSIGGILAKVFLSSLKRVILAPFSFLSIKFGGGAELSFLDFEPGTSVIPEKEIPKLEALAKAFAERPELKLDITGRYDPAADGKGLAKAAIQRKVRMLKRKDLQEKGQTVLTNQLKIEPDEYPALLERVYREENFKKPRNLIGMQKKLSTAEMEKLLMDNYEASEEEFLALASQRAERIKAWLVDNGKLQDSRVFLLASKAGEAGENGESAARVDFAVQ